MRSIISFLITISFAITASALDPSGTWSIEISAPDGQIYHPVATITKSQDSLAGSYYSPRTDQTFDLRDVKLVSDKALHFTLEIQRLKVAYVGNIEGNKMKGPAHIVFDGQHYQADFTATRKAETVSVSGTWNMETERQGNTNQSTMMLSVANDGKISGTRESRGRTVEIEDAKLEDGVLTFSTRGQFQGYDYVAEYRGQVEGDTIKGTLIVSAASAGVSREFLWTANRVD